MTDPVTHALNVTLAVLGGLILLMVIAGFLTSADIHLPSPDDVLEAMFEVIKNRRQNKTMRRRRRRQRRWKAGIRIIQRKQEREAQRQMTRSEREAARSVAAEISHSLAIHQEILERMYGRNAAPTSMVLWDTYNAGKRREGR